MVRRQPVGRRSKPTSRNAGLSQHRSERPLPVCLRAYLRRLLLPDQLFDLYEPVGAGRHHCANRVARRPAELYVYRNPGEEIEQAISLNGTAYSDLPNAFKYRKEYVKGCSCKEAEYNPTEIEAATRRPRPRRRRGKPGAKKKASAPAAEAAAPPADAQQAPTQLNLEMTGTAANAPAEQAAAPASPPDPAAAAAPAQPAAPAPQAQQSSMTKSKSAQ